MAATLSASDQQFLQRLHRLGSATVHELCEELGVTATAVRQRLVRLETHGAVSRKTVHHGRGRPHHTYNVTETGLRELGDNYAELALLLWKEMKQIDEEEVRVRVLSRLRAALVERYGRVVTATEPPERVRQLAVALRERGFDVELEEPPWTGTLPILREHNCPYHQLASRDSSICELEQSVFSDVLGAPVRLTACCQQGHSCCEFQVVGNDDS